MVVKALWLIKGQKLEGNLLLILKIALREHLAGELTFWENQSGGRPGSAKGLIALLTDTLTKLRKALLHTKQQKEGRYAEFKIWIKFWNKKNTTGSILKHVPKENDTTF